MQIMSIIVILLRFMYPDVSVQIKISIRKTKIIRIITNESNPQTENRKPKSAGTRKNGWLSNSNSNSTKAAARVCRSQKPWACKQHQQQHPFLSFIPSKGELQIQLKYSSHPQINCPWKPTQPIFLVPSSQTTK